MGASSEALAMMALPAPRAGAVFQVRRQSGRIQGERQATTPSGSRSVVNRVWSGALNESAKFTASDGAALDELGVSVAVSGDTGVAGATEDNVSANINQGVHDQRDYDTQLDYIHFNPVKHGWVPRVADWPHSSFHRFVRLGLYPSEWAAPAATREWELE